LILPILTVIEIGFGCAFTKDYANRSATIAGSAKAGTHATGVLLRLVRCAPPTRPNRSMNHASGVRTERAGSISSPAADIF
jgi:hypothetical protein